MAGSSLLRMGLSRHLWRSPLPYNTASFLLLVAPLLFMISVGRHHTAKSKKQEMSKARNTYSNKRYTH